MKDFGKSLVDKSVPWRKGASWPSVALQGLVLGAAGIYVLADKSGAASAILQLIALVLLLTSLLAMAAELRTGGSDIATYSAFRAGIGAAIGAIGTIRWFWDFIDDRPLRLILGWGLIAYALISLVAVIAVRGRSGIEPGGIVMSLLTIVLGVILLINDNAQGSSTLNLLGTILIVFSVLLLAFAFYLFQAKSKAAHAK